MCLCIFYLFVHRLFLTFRPFFYYRRLISSGLLGLSVCLHFWTYRQHVGKDRDPLLDSVQNGRVSVLFLLVAWNSGHNQFVSGYQMDRWSDANVWNYGQSWKCKYLFKSRKGSENGAVGQVGITFLSFPSRENVVTICLNCFCPCCSDSLLLWSLIVIVDRLYYFLFVLQTSTCLQSSCRATAKSQTRTRITWIGACRRNWGKCSFVFDCCGSGDCCVILLLSHCDQLVMGSINKPLILHFCLSLP